MAFINGNEILFSARIGGDNSDSYSTWGYIKHLCELGIADKELTAGMQFEDHSDKYGDVIFDVVNVAPTEVIIQTHSIIGDHISIGYWETWANVYYDDIYVDAAISAGEDFVIQIDVYYNDELMTEAATTEVWKASEGIPVGTYAYDDLVGICENSEVDDTEDLKLFICKELGYDVDDPPAILLADYAASVNDDMSEDFQKNVGTGFVPLLENIGGKEYEWSWQYYKDDESDPMYSGTSELRSKGGDWAICIDGTIQDLYIDYGYYIANAIDYTGSYVEITNGDCGIAPAFKITGGGN